MAARRHDASRQWLKEQLGLGDTENTVVVTHHAPHPRSIPLEFEGHPLSPCYSRDLGALMGKASTWIHGHIHNSLDYQVRGTRIVTNPRGYRRLLVLNRISIKLNESDDHQLRPRHARQRVQQKCHHRHQQHQLPQAPAVE